MEEQLRALIEGALAAQDRERIANEQLRVAERAHAEAVNQLRTEIANLDHTLSNRVAVYGDSIVRLTGGPGPNGIREIILIPLVQVLKAAPPTPPVEQPVTPKSQPPVPPPSHSTNPPRAGKR